MHNKIGIGRYRVTFVMSLALLSAAAWIATPKYLSAGVNTRTAFAAQNAKQSAKAATAFANSAAFRDGVFQAKLAKARGELPRVSQGRWAFGADKAAFALGYQHQYRTATRMVPTGPLSAQLRVN